MSRFNKMALSSAALVLACSGAAMGQLTVQEPVIDNREFVGDTTRVLFDIAGAGGDTITGMTAQFVVVRENGNSTGVGTPRAVPAGAVYADTSDFTVPGAFFAIVGGNDDVIVDMARLFSGSGDLVMDRTDALNSIGMPGIDGSINQTIYIEFTLTTDGPATFTTTSPTAPGAPEAADATNGGVEAGVEFVTDDAADVSPQYIPAPELSSATISDPSGTPILNYIFNRVLNTGNASNDLNQFVIANINEDDLLIDGAAPTMAPTGVAFGPTNDVVRATFPMGTVSNGDTAGFAADFTGMDNLPDARDFVGYSLVTISAGATNAIELAATGAVFTSGSAIGGGTGVLQVIFNQALSNAGTADAYDIQLNGQNLVADIGAAFGVPAIDALDPTRVNITIDLNTVGTDDIGIAPNGRALDFNVGVDFDGVGVLDHAQLPFFVTVTDGGTTDPADALGNNLDLGGMDFVDTNAIGDGVEPAFQFAATLDTDNNGLIDAVALVFDETVSGASITGIDITALDASMVTDISMREAGTGVLPAAAAITLMGGNQDLPDTFTASVDTVDLVPGTDNDTFQVNNAVVFSGLDLTTFADNMAAEPSSGDTSNFNIAYDTDMGTITDSDGNAYMPGGVDVQTVDTDRAAPALLDAYYFTGDNQGGSNDQLSVEQDGNVGDQTDNDRAFMVFSEDLADNTADETGFTADGTTFDTANDNDGRLAGGTMDNMFTLENEDNVEFGPGTTVALNGGVDISDGDGNEAVGSQVAMDGVAPYIPLQNDGGTIDSAFLVDDDNDGFADRVFLQFTQDIVQANLASDGSDFQSFGANSGTITGADTLTGTDNSIVVLTLVDGEVTMNSDADFRYLGSTAAMLIEAAANGNTVTDTDSTFTAQEINEPFRNSLSPDVMIIVGTLMGPDGVTPAPIGTRVYGALAIPTIDCVVADHNGVVFEYRYDDREYSTEDSLDAFNNVFLGLRSYLYLSRQLDNEQDFMNVKYTDDEDNGSGIVTDVIDITLNTRNLSNITFSGTGETGQDRVRGTAKLCWRLIRGSTTPQGLYSSGFGGDSSNFLFSESVISEAGGRYEIHVSGIGGVFTGSPIAGLDLPVIMWAQLPTGERYALSSLVTSASTNDFDQDGVLGNGIIFAPNNLTQDSDGTASDATTINFNLANVGHAQIFPGWNMVPFGRIGGFANNSRDIPELPNGVNEGNIVDGAVLAVSPFDQFVFWDDNDDDGIFNSDDGGFGEMFVDFDCVDHMRFTLTTNGVQMGSGMTALVGGYGTGVLNLSGNDFGVFQFGAPIPAGAIFASAPISGSAARATNGWLLVSTSAESMPATNFFTTNPGSDYIINFDNMGDDGIAVRSLSVTPGDANANDLEELPAWSAPFVHYIN